MKIIETTIPDLLLIEPKVFGDQRGFFLETYHKDRYEEHGLKAQFLQDNHSRSEFGVLRGLHCQTNHPQGKLVAVNRGKVYDVAVDIRPGSKTFGQWQGFILDDENHQQLYVPPGFAHGFCVLSEWADFTYKCTDYYHPEDEIGIIYDDPNLGIQWPIDNPKLSAKDSQYPKLSDIKPEALPKV